MSKQKLQITLPEAVVESLLKLSENTGYSKSILIAMAIEGMVKNKEKGESDENK